MSAALRTAAEPDVPGVHVLMFPEGTPVELYDFEVLTMVLSAKNWRAHCGPVCLCSDSRAHGFLKSLGVLGLYDRSCLFDDEEFAGVNRNFFWAAGKVLAIRKFKAPFVILDLDCMVRRRPRFDFEAAVQPLNLEKEYPCYRDCDVKYSRFLTWFSGADWEAKPVNVGMLGYYSDAFKEDYLRVAEYAMREITSRDIDYPYLDRYRDHIIFVEQKLLPMVASRRGERVSLFEEGLFDQYLSTSGTLHLWGRKGALCNDPRAKVRQMEEMLDEYPNAAGGLANRRTAWEIGHPVATTRVFTERGWSDQATKRWLFGVSGPAIATPMPRMLCSPMPCGVTQSTAVIHFETKAVVDAYVEYGLSEKEIGKYRTAPVSSANIFEIRIPNGEADFPAGSRVHYRVRARLAEKGVYSEGIPHRFRLSRPYRDEGPWCCSVGADCRGDEINTQHDSFKDYHWPAAGRAGEDFHLAPGGLIHAAPGPDSGMDAWRSIRNDVEGLGREGEKCGDLPVFSCIGNDELDKKHVAARRDLLPLGAFLSLPGQQTNDIDRDWKERYYYFTWGQVLFIGMDSETSGPGYPIGAWQQQWVESVLVTHGSYKWKVLFAHKAADESDPAHGWDTIADVPIIRRWLLDLIEAHGVQIFAHGHYHGWRIQKRAGREWHICCAWGSTPHTSRGTWNGESRFCRLRFGERWRRAAYETDPDWMTVELVDPFTATAAGGTVERYYPIRHDLSEAGPA